MRLLHLISIAGTVLAVPPVVDYVSTTPVAPSQCSATSVVVPPRAAICDQAGHFAAPAYLDGVIQVNKTATCADYCETNAECLSFSFEPAKGTCQLYSKHIRDMSHKNGTVFEGMYVYGRNCYACDLDISTTASSYSTTSVLSSLSKQSTALTSTSRNSTSRVSSSSTSSHHNGTSSTRTTSQVAVSDTLLSTASSSRTSTSSTSSVSFSSVPTTSSLLSSTSKASSSSVFSPSSQNTTPTSSLSTTSTITAAVATTSVASEDCSFVTPSYLANHSEVIPIDGTQYSIGYHGVSSTFALKRDDLPTVLVRSTSTSLLILNSTSGSFGFTTAGDVIYVGSDCTDAWVVSTGQNTTTSVVAKRQALPPTKSTINVRLQVVNYDGLPNTCPITPVLACTDLSGTTQTINEDFSMIYDNDQADYFGFCPFPAGLATDSCIDTLESFHQIISVSNQLIGTIQLLTAASDAACTAIIAALALETAGAALPATAAIEAACILAVNYIKDLLKDGATNALGLGFNAANTCTALGIGAPNYLYAIAVVDAELPTPTIFATTFSGVNPPDVSQTASINYYVAACSTATTSVAVSTPSSTITPECPQGPAYITDATLALYSDFCATNDLHACFAAANDGIGACDVAGYYDVYEVDACAAPFEDWNDACYATFEDLYDQCNAQGKVWIPSKDPDRIYD